MAIRISGLSSGMDTEALVSDLVKAYKTKGDQYTKKKTKIEWKQEAWTDLNKKIKSFFSKSASNMRFSTSYSKKATSVSDSTKASVVTSDTAVNGTQTLAVKSLASSGYLTGGVVKTDANGDEVSSSTTLAQLGYSSAEKTTIAISQGQPDENGVYSGEPKTFEVDGTTTIAEFTKLVSNAGYNANYDTATGRMFISSKESGAANDFTFTGGSAVTDLLKLTGTDSQGKEVAKKLVGSDAKIELNGVEYTSSSNVFSVNGLTITAKDVTGNEEDGYSNLTITTDTDYEDIYDNIKSFIKEYNSLINEMDKLFNAASSGSYEPLTDEEKEAMSDSDVEKWEKKIKDALLRNDSDLEKISSAMRTSMLKTYNVGSEENPVMMSLSSFGISTLGYFEAADNEKNMFHIDGNEDDEYTSGNADQLKSMIASNPEAVSSFFTQLATGLYDSMNEIQKNSDNYTSYGSFYSDKKLQSDYVDQTNQITKWEDYVKGIEDRYYKQFTAMEKSMSSLNSQSSYLSSLFTS